MFPLCKKTQHIMCPIWYISWATFCNKPMISEAKHIIEDCFLLIYSLMLWFLVRGGGVGFAVFIQESRPQIQDHLQHLTSKIVLSISTQEAREGEFGGQTWKGHISLLLSLTGPNSFFQ